MTLFDCEPQGFFGPHKMVLADEFVKRRGPDAICQWFHKTAKAERDIRSSLGLYYSEKLS
jgi:hypothetical protein